MSDVDARPGAAAALPREPSPGAAIKNEIPSSRIHSLRNEIHTAPGGAVTDLRRRLAGRFLAIGLALAALAALTGCAAAPVAVPSPAAVMAPAAVDPFRVLVFDAGRSVALCTDYPLHPAALFACALHGECTGNLRCAPYTELEAERLDLHYVCCL